MAVPSPCPLCGVTQEKDKTGCGEDDCPERPRPWAAAPEDEKWLEPHQYKRTGYAKA